VQIYCGIDWAEAHHDVAVIDDTGRQLVKRRITDDLPGVTGLCQVLADAVASAQPADPGDVFVPVDVAIETDRGLLVAALRAAGHRVWSINPKAVDRYRDRYSSSRAKSDPGDALILADVLRTDGQAHRQLPSDSHLATAIGVLARTQQDLARRRRSESQAVRSLLREFLPAALLAFPDLTTATAMLLLTAAPTPTAAAALTSDRSSTSCDRPAAERCPSKPTALPRSSPRGSFVSRWRWRTRWARRWAPWWLLCGAPSTPSATSRSPCRLRSSSTHTLESWTACPDSASSWRPGCWPSSATTPTASPAPRAGGPTPGPHQ